VHIIAPFIIIQCVHFHTVHEILFYGNTLTGSLNKPEINK